MTSDNRRRFLLAGTLLLALVPSSIVRAERVGTAGAVNPASRGTPPSAATRIIEMGSQIVRRERIQTSAVGSVQLVFIDKTTLNIGPNSDMVIDEFVYDPDKSAGKLSASLARGAMRFVGGNISHSGGATIRTPASTIGIRGGVTTVAHDARTGTRVISHFGTLTVTSLAGTEIIRRPGFEVTVAGAGQPPSAPFRVTQAELEAMNRVLTSKAGQSGGARSKPTPSKVQQAGVGSQSDGISPASVRSLQAQTLAQNGQTVLLQTIARQDMVSETVQQGQQATAAAVTAAENPPPSSGDAGEFYFGFAGGLASSERKSTGGPVDTRGGPFIVRGAAVIIDADRSSRVSAISIYREDGGGDADDFSSGTFVQGQLPGVAPSELASKINDTTVTPTQTLVSSDALKGAHPGVNFCACEYTRWGGWALSATRSIQQGAATQTDKADLFWVAGRLSDPAEIPLTGTASYGGHIIGNFTDGGAQRQAAGNFSATVDFAAGSGTMAVPNLDGRAYSGSFSQYSNAFGGSLTGTGGADMNVVGMFFRGSASPVQDIGGNFSVTGPGNYLGGGIFAGSKQ